MNKLSFAMQLSVSRFLSFYLVLVHLSLVSVVFIFATSSLITQLTIVTITVHWAYCRWRYSDGKSPCWVSQVVYNHENWSLTVNNEPVAVTLIQATVWRQLVVMGFQSESSSRIYSVVVFPDSADVEIRRQLRVMLTHLPIWAS